MLTESSVQASFLKLISKPNVDEDTLDKAEQLLDHLRPESPLRHRLQEHVDELRERATTK